MKRFIIAVSILAVLAIGVGYAAWFRGFYLDLDPDAPITAVFRTEGKDLLRQTGTEEWETFTIRGVDLSSNLPGHPVLEFAPEPEDYLRWLEAIAELGANTVRVYTVMDADFYEALYTYNTTHDQSLYLLQGLQVSDTANYGSEDVYGEGFLDLLLENGRTAVDVIHGSRIITLGNTSGTGRYRWDVSPWVIGYLVGHEWDGGNIAYTNQSTTHPTSYTGTYFTTSPDATRFEVVMARVMDQITAYETSKYKVQRLIGFVNDASNDPFDYQELYDARFLKYSQTDAEHVLTTDALLSGYFAAYRLSSFSQDYIQYLTDAQTAALGDLLRDLDTTDLYHGYLDLLSRYHTMPVVAAGYGFSTARVPTFEGEGPLNEREQGEALVQVWQDADRVGWAGVFVSTWQDVWDRRTWNTSYATYAFRDPIWQDVQTDGQCYGLMEFWLGGEERVCTVDGDPSEWTAEDVVLETGGGSLSMKYDEKFIYFYAQGFDPQAETIYIPIDTTPKTGTTYCENYDLTFQRPVDFVIRIDSTGGSRVVVQERYEVMRALYLKDTEMVDAYVNEVDVDTPVFKEIDLVLQFLPEGGGRGLKENYETYETGNLRCGNANPDADDFDSLADYMFTADGVEIRIPWQLLNFSNPSEMMIHDDYYEHYGVENLHIDEMYVGLSWGDGAQERISMASFPLEGWGKTVTYHERLKRSYYILQEYWAGLGS